MDEARGGCQVLKFRLSQLQQCITFHLVSGKNHKRCGCESRLAICYLGSLAGCAPKAAAKWVLILQYIIDLGATVQR